MRFTETVNVARHDILGEFEGMEKDIFAKKTECDGNAHGGAVEFSAFVAAGDGIHGRNLPIFACFLLTLGVFSAVFCWRGTGEMISKTWAAWDLETRERGDGRAAARRAAWLALL
jgi:hypothetical protein